MENPTPSTSRFEIPKSLAQVDWRSWLPSRGNVVFTLVIVFALFWAQSANALPWSAPAQVATSTGTWPYQGRLADGTGNPITNTVPMIFRLYNAATGGVPLWEEQWTGPNSVQVSDGLFNVMLGSLTPIPQAVVSNNGSLWLGITAGTDDEMAPRIQLGSVPFANTVPDGSIGTAKLADGSVTQAKLGTDISFVPPNGSVTTEKIANGSVTSSKMATGAVQLVQTNMVISDVNTSGWTLHTGTGDRYYRQSITFPTPYSQIPTVVAGLSYFDFPSTTSRPYIVHLTIENITKTGFVLVFHTYGNAMVNAAGATWTAVGYP